MNETTRLFLEQIATGTSQILPAGALEKKLERGTPLNIKLGADPTAPDLHLGHAVVLSKLRQFQDAGHKITFIVGDFTARIGDPTGKSKTRPPLDEATIAKNSETYLAQVTRILDKDKTTIVRNSDWLSSISLADFIKIGAQVSLARIIEREDFMTRFKNNVTISFHELFYPLLQGYDSVAIKSDVELGGTDQTFNLLMGRHLQEQVGQEGQVILTVPLLEGLDGVQKMSKSLGNYIGLTEAPEQAFGKLMSISDTLMWRYYELLTSKTKSEIESLKTEVSTGKRHPLVCKKEMASLIVSRFWSPAEAASGQAHFEGLFQKKEFDHATPVSLSSPAITPLWIVSLLRELGAIESSSEARRLIESGAVSLNGEKITDFNHQVTWKVGDIVRVGKHRIYSLKSA